MGQCVRGACQGLRRSECMHSYSSGGLEGRHSAPRPQLEAAGEDGALALARRGARSGPSQLRAPPPRHRRPSRCMGRSTRRGGAQRPALVLVLLLRRARPTCARREHHARTCGLRRTFATTSAAPSTSAALGSTVAPAAAYSSSVKLAACPAPCCTSTRLKPFFMEAATAAGASATRRSPAVISRGTPSVSCDHGVYDTPGLPAGGWASEAAREEAARAAAVHRNPKNGAPPAVGPAAAAQRATEGAPRRAEAEASASSAATDMGPAAPRPGCGAARAGVPMRHQPTRYLSPLRAAPWRRLVHGLALAPARNRRVSCMIQTKGVSSARHARMQGSSEPPPAGRSAHWVTAWAALASQSPRPSPPRVRLPRRPRPRRALHRLQPQWRARSGIKASVSAYDREGGGRT